VVAKKLAQVFISKTINFRIL